MYISKDIKDRLVDALITAFIFAAALSWQKTFAEVMKAILPVESYVWSELSASAGITAIAITLVYLLIKSSRIADDSLGLKAEEQSDPTREATR